MSTPFTNSYTEDHVYDEGAEACQEGDIVDFGTVFLPIFYSCVFAFGLVGNLLVVFVLTNSQKPKSITDIYLLNLAFSDLLFVATLPFWIHYVISDQGFSNAVCKLITAFFFIGFFGGIFFITIISIDRYLAVVLATHSMRNRTVQHGVTISLSVWAVAILVAAPQFMFTKQNGSECLGDYPEILQEVWPVLQNVGANLLGFLLPLLTMSYCYLRIIWTLFSCKNHKKSKAIKLIFLVVIMFFLFWTPYNVMIFLETLKAFHFFPSCDVKKKLRLALSVTETIAFSHCCLNPLIYVFAGQKFRRHLYHLYRKYLAILCRHPVEVSFYPSESQRSRRESVLSSNFTECTSHGDVSILL
ncbi:CX3C chemokine receptor 1 [Loxodonta africana]|uniref:CX3C chemokine receptor 1 n=1 Tax=Loxodonta africana TaxID=9785 RepID=G3SUZ4_LOXAF|nr:CX3C chemokine receptor 1 [Loxodonta africana]XP_023410584.1 CX3C chemokine receptor 1 [Loxodonta africana]XP_023410585.1 CX3C chemokine receptor 1 [Loxodonta africana]XP_049726889.1 CX3C chemokine receptor 1 [Elephas maximus indicus]XP_049726890.1 CX3C chemokine receptor 1 [Elephas maximus indicus]XP_049726891.1 CX3C chemokine receptor 1 [Elephas maximus indicus]XP_049726892.1 CX3C chemokine receptor 1 [Elephas maximus indicus]XP_049726893.1 CX3C chemokine receptor 1 [Elephas maximus ind